MTYSIVYFRRALLFAMLLILGNVSADAKTLTYATWQPVASSSLHTQSLKWFDEQLKERTGGEDSLQIYWGGTVAGQSAISDAVQSRLAEMGDLIVPYFPDQYRLNNVISFFWPQPNSPRELGRIMSDLQDTYPQFRKELAKHNLKIIALRPLGYYGMLCKKPIHNLADFKGVRIRSYGIALPAIINAIGAVPVPLSTSATYQALERGVVDCAPINPILGHSWKYDEVARYFIDIPIGASWGQYIVINKDVFEGLSPKLQKILTQLGKDYLTYFTNQQKEKRNQVLQAWRSEKDFRIIEFPRDEFLSEVLSSPEVQAVRQKWIDYAKKQGLPAEKIAQKFRFEDQETLIKAQ